jgi:hypothetical protein
MITRKYLVSELAKLGYSYRPILGEASAKTIKGEKIGYLTAICYLAPDDEICALAKLAGCMAACLRSAGRGAFDNVQRARLAKTEFYKACPQAFMLCMAIDTLALMGRAAKRRMTPLVRPNGTSDICFENIKIDALDGQTIFQAFPSVQFYDYTKHPGRKLTGKTAGNYDLTYSFSGITPAPLFHKAQANESVSRVAVVFHKREDIPKFFRAMPCVDGDDTDVRHIEPKNVVVALYAKGKAKQDTGGFVQYAGQDYPKWFV